MPKSRDNIKSLIDSIARGKLDPKGAVDSFIPKRGVDRLHNGTESENKMKCTNKECDFEMQSDNQGYATCPKCGAATVGVEEITYGSPDSENPAIKMASYRVIKNLDKDPIPQFTLSDLRPGDQFIFISTLPEGGKKNVKYTIIPAKRGTVTFTDEFNKANTVPLSKGLLFDVKMLNSEFPDPNRRFIRGDRVKNRGTNRVGVVVSIKDMGYIVRYEDGEKELTPGTNLQLIHKDSTTKSYIEERGEKWIVGFGDFRRECGDFKEALTTLEAENRPAFNRYAKMIVVSPNGYSRDVIELLIKLDPRVWGRRENLLKHGYIKDNKEYEEVKRKFEL